MVRMLAVIVLAWGASSIRALEGGNISSDTKQQLIELLQRRFEIAPNTQLNLVERESTPGFTRVTVFSSTPGHPFEKEMYVFPKEGLVFERVGLLMGDVSQQELKERHDVAERLNRDESPHCGREAARVVVVMYSDFQCGYCRDAERILRQRIQSGTDGNVQLVLKQHPLASHEWARAAARNSVCLYRQSNELFWEFADFVFGHQSEIDADNLGAKVAEFVQSRPQVDRGAFRTCLESTEPDLMILRDENSGVAVGVNATPTFFINGGKVVGMGDEAAFLQMLDRREAPPTH